MIVAAVLTVAAGLAADRPAVDARSGASLRAPVVFAPGGQVERRRGLRRAHPAATLVERFLESFTRYEVGARGSRWRVILRRSATSELVEELLRRPPRILPGVARAAVEQIRLGRITRSRATAVAMLRRAGATFSLTVVADRRGGRWRVVEVRR